MLTAAERADIRYYLGFSARFFQTDTQLEFAMNAITTQPEAQVLVLADIVRLKAIDVNLEATYGRLKATKVCSIQLAHGKELCVFKSEGRRIVGRVASTLGVSVRHDVFGSSFSAGQTGFPGSNGMRHG